MLFEITPPTNEWELRFAWLPTLVTKSWGKYKERDRYYIAWLGRYYVRLGVDGEIETRSPSLHFVKGSSCWDT